MDIIKIKNNNLREWKQEKNMKVHHSRMSSVLA